VGIYPYRSRSEILKVKYLRVGSGLISAGALVTSPIGYKQLESKDEKMNSRLDVRTRRGVTGAQKEYDCRFKHSYQEPEKKKKIKVIKIEKGVM
jgi:hypothetical protein